MADEAGSEVSNRNEVTEGNVTHIETKEVVEMETWAQEDNEWFKHFGPEEMRAMVTLKLHDPKAVFQLRKRQEEIKAAEKWRKQLGIKVIEYDPDIDAIIVETKKHKLKFYLS